LIYSTVALLILLHSGTTTVASEAKIVEITDRGFIFSIDGKTVAADDNPQTHYWADRDRALRDRFKAGDSVGVRIKTDVSPAELRELADAASWRWLNNLRKEAVGGVVVKADTKWLTLKLDDGSSFTYKLTAKSSAQIAGAATPVSSLAPGAHVFVKGRLTSTLETSAAMVTDIRPEPERKTSRSKTSALRLAATGQIRGSVETVRASLRMIDVKVQDHLLHVTYSKDTTFAQNGNRIGAMDIQKGWEALVTYRRDGYGRLIASKVELFVRAEP